MQSIADDLRAAAALDAATATQLLDAATALESFSHAPVTLAQAKRVERVLTAAVVDAIAEGLRVDYLDGSGGDPTRLTGLVESRYALSALLLAAASSDPALAERGRLGAEALLPLATELTPDEAEGVMFTAALIPDSPVAALLVEAAQTRLRREPLTPAREWAESLGLDLPFVRWELGVEIPGELPLTHSISDRPGVQSSFGTRLTGTTRGTTILSNGNPRPGATVAYEHRRTPAIAGEIASPRALDELPAVIDALMAASPGIALELAAAKVRVSPGKVFSAKDKKRVLAWVQESAGRGPAA